MDSNSSLGAIVVAAGSSTRMGGIDKTFNPILEKPMITYCLDTLESFAVITQIVLVVAKASLNKGQDIIKNNTYKKLTTVCAGGERRQDSVRIGLTNIQNCSYVLVHDGARPCITKEIVQRAINSVSATGAATAGVPTTDTIKIVGKNDTVVSTPPRENLWNIQTPQIFKYDLIRKAHLLKPNTYITDDSTLVEQMGVAVKVFWGSYSNIKITNAEDIYIAESTLRENQEA